MTNQADQLRAMVARDKAREDPGYERTPQAFLADIACAGGFWGAIENGVIAENYDLPKLVAFAWLRVTAAYRSAEGALAAFETSARAGGMEIDRWTGGVDPQRDTL